MKSTNIFGIILIILGIYVILSEFGLVPSLSLYSDVMSFNANVINPLEVVKQGQTIYIRTSATNTGNFKWNTLTFYMIVSYNGEDFCGFKNIVPGTYYTDFTITNDLFKNQKFVAGYNSYTSVCVIRNGKNYVDNYNFNYQFKNIEPKQSVEYVFSLNVSKEYIVGGKIYISVFPVVTSDYGNYIGPSKTFTFDVGLPILGSSSILSIILIGVIMLVGGVIIFFLPKKFFGKAI